ncbi:ferric-chelate reductase Frp1 [Cladophialophora chaetospira]|uniref:ferric-chelate reductase (NADPH) n=1 Tax=Cladophialophora chaetospira TaxID=386627 RepID=A0AA39CPB1_9EURO|nr:ferric-chelate reductase Frp1 [Cladophialophora chaetospira]
MDMSGMSGMDMSTAGMFTPTNKKVAHLYWYIVAGVVGVLVFRRLVDRARISRNKRKNQNQPGLVPGRPQNAFEQFYDTTITICRELAYPQLWTGTGKSSKYFTPPPLGRCLLLLTYWAVILTMLWSNVILSPSASNYAYKWEIVGFRAAWVSVTQLPLIYILSGKANIITLLTGISYERLNWLHRWVGRTIFLTVIVHWSYFFTEWSIADFVKLEFETMPMVKYGFGAWATLGWMVITGFGFFRTLSYELWFLQHLAAALVLLWLVHKHVPSYAAYNVWFAVGVVVFDRVVRTVLVLVINFHVLPSKTASTSPARRIGHEAEVVNLSNEFIRVKIRNVKFSWRPGQHVYLSIPRAGILEAHPFTIASVPKSISGQPGSNDVELYLRVHNGFTKRLHRRCQNQMTPRTFLSFVSGPWGNPPSIERFESLIFVATGNGASFTLPIFRQTVLANSNIRHISFVWIFRRAEQLEWFREQLQSAAATARKRNVKVNIQIFITGDAPSRPRSPADSDSLLKQASDTDSTQEEKSGHGLPKPSTEADLLKSPADKQEAGTVRQNSVSSSSISSDRPPIYVGYGRPQLDGLVRPVVEDAWGETGILACGGSQFTGQMRNYVARLSDERGVHKGTGAQGIYLFCETYGW